MFCLVRPPGVETFRIGTLTLTPPLGAAYVAGALEASGRPVHVIDAVAEAPRTHTAYFRGYLVGLGLEDIVRRIPPGATAVGISCIFTHEWPAVVRLVELVKQARPELPVVVGGEHVTSMPEFSLATSAADVLVLGEGEETVVDLADALERGRPLETVDGIAFRRDDEVVVNRRRTRTIDVDAIPRPAWHRFDLATYHAHRFVGGMYSSALTVPILATRGCPYQCTYCSAPNMWTPRWIPREPSAVVDEIEHWVRTLGAGNFPFQDLTAIVRKEWIVAFCREIVARGLRISWQLPSGTRSEAIDDEVAALLRASGMISMAYAPESGSEETRRYIKKKMRTDRLFDSIRAAAAADLNVTTYVVIGFPHDRRAHMRETLAFARQIARAGVTDLGTGYYMALPGTELFRTLQAAGRIGLNRRYFQHRQEGLALVPAASYCDTMGRAELCWWKLRFTAAFYLRRLRAIGSRQLVRSLRETFSSADHQSKLQTAVRVSLKNLRIAVAVHFGRRWLPRRVEPAMFSLWNDTFQAIASGRRAAGVELAITPPATELHRQNVVEAVRLEHETVRTIGIPRLASPAT